MALRRLDGAMLEMACEATPPTMNELETRRERGSFVPARSSASGIPTKRLTDRFENYHPERDGMQEALQLVKDVADGKAWCCALLGDGDLGKTHLAIAAMHAFHDGGLLRSVFWTVPDFLEWLRVRRYGQDRQERSIMDIASAYLEQDILLVLDDLGTENATDWAYEQLYRVINARRDNQLPTIVTSNLGLDALDKRLLARLKPGLVVCRKQEAKR